MMVNVEKLINRIEDRKLRRMVRELLLEPNIGLDGERLPLEKCPGGARIHHAYAGGLLQHTVSTARLALTLCDLLEELYGGEVDKDQVLAGALLHDVMKCYVYAKADSGFVSSHIGEQIDHLTLLVAEMLRRGFPIEVVHVVAAHHGDQSPVKPKTLEALIVSIADYADSELSRKVLRAAEYLLRRATGEDARGISSREALEVLKVKAREGWEGVRLLRLGET